MWYVEGIGAIKSPRGITKNDIQYPRNIFTLWTKAELAAIGIKPAQIVQPDHRYVSTGQISWDTSGNEAIGTYTSTDKDSNDLKFSRIAKVKSIANGILKKTDWMVIREADGGTAMSADWKTYRVAVRTMSNTKETEINALIDLNSVKAWDSADGVGNGWPQEP